MKAWHLFLMLLMLATSAMAYQGPYYQNQQISFPSNCLDANKQFVESTQNITIFYPNGTVWLADVVMHNISVGQFQTNLTTPNVTGTYTVAKTCWDGTGEEAQGGDTFEVVDFEEAIGMSQVALLLGFCLLTLALFYLARRHSSMDNLNKLLAPAFHLAGMYSLLLPLLYISNIGLIDPLGDTVMFIGLVCVVIYSLVYMPITLLTLTGKFITQESNKAFRFSKRLDKSRW